MRIGEIKNIVQASLNENDLIVIKHEAIFGGQAYKVTNYLDVINTLEVLADQSWNDAVYTEIEKIKSKYPDSQVNTLEAPDFNQLNSYVSTVNQKVPLFYSVLESLVQDQDEKMINLKLPVTIQSIKELSSFNSELEKMFKCFNFAGEFQFKGFDRGTSWYEIFVTGEALYRYFIACLAVAYGIIKLKETYYNSENAKLSYLASLKKGEEKTEEGERKFCDRYIEEALQKGIEDLAKKIEEKNGKEEKEVISGLVIATSKLIEKMEEGAEFHLSLNPPTYVGETSNGLVIDYKSIPVLKEQKEVKQVEAPKAKDEK